MTTNDDNWEPSPDELEKAKVIWKEYENQFASIEAMEFDGANGLPPNWIPESTIVRFKRTRNYFLVDCGYTADLLKKRIDYYCEHGIPPFHIHPNHKLVDRGALNLLLGFLANLRWIASLGPSEGLKELVNIDAANANLGAKRRKSLEDFGRRRGSDIKDERSVEHARWKAEADKIRSANPNHRFSKRCLAKIVKQNLQISDSTETIRKQI